MTSSTSCLESIRLTRGSIENTDDTSVAAPYAASGQNIPGTSTRSRFLTSSASPQRHRDREQDVGRGDRDLHGGREPQQRDAGRALQRRRRQRGHASTQLSDQVSVAVRSSMPAPASARSAASITPAGIERGQAAEITRGARALVARADRAAPAVRGRRSGWAGIARAPSAPAAWARTSRRRACGWSRQRAAVPCRPRRTPGFVRSALSAPADRILPDRRSGARPRRADRARPGQSAPAALRSDGPELRTTRRSGCAAASADSRVGEKILRPSPERIAGADVQHSERRRRADARTGQPAPRSAHRLPRRAASPPRSRSASAGPPLHPGIASSRSH